MTPKGDEQIARIMAASCRPSARTGPVAAIMLSVHAMKGMAAGDTQQGGALIVDTALPTGSIAFTSAFICIHPKINKNL